MGRDFAASYSHLFIILAKIYVLKRRYKKEGIGESIGENIHRTLHSAKRTHQEVNNYPNHFGMIGTPHTISAVAKSSDQTHQNLLHSIF